MKLTVINEENVNACVHIPPIYIAPNQPLNAQQDFIEALTATTRTPSTGVWIRNIWNH